MRWLTTCVLALCLPVMPASAQSPPDPPGQASLGESADVDRAGILRDFAITLAAQQTYRLPRREVREHLGGPFWRDYVESITHLQKGFWDGDEPWTWNLVVHPVMGGLSYHQARTRGASPREAFLWTAAYSTHFELGVLGQAGLGNNRVSPVDLILTPVAGTLWAAFEEWIERRYFQADGGSRLLRSLLPVHALGNLLRGRAPWRRHAELSSGRKR
jgi:hypothetical protein